MTTPEPPQPAPQSEPPEPIQPHISLDDIPAVPMRPDPWISQIVERHDPRFWNEARETD
jgi:hypothetical protein